MISGLFKQFKPAIFFLLKFVGLYFVLNLAYGGFVKYYSPKPDPATEWVTDQTAGILNRMGWKTEIKNHPAKPTTSIEYQGTGILSVFEGCNGINVGIIFLCFLFAFGPVNKRLLWFLPAGLVAIHVFNLARIFGLFFVVLYLPNAVYFTHKYLFTAVIYAVVFVLWMVWIRISYIRPT